MAAKRPFIVADAETDPFRFGRIPKPFIWGIYDGNAVTFFQTTAEFLEYVSQQEVIVYAHNGGKFDWHFLFPFFDKWDEELLIINGRLARFKIGLAEFRDSFSILPVPLAAYKKTAINYDIFEPIKRDIPENAKAIRDYLTDDLVDLYTLIAAFEEQFGRHLTMAGASMKQWEKTYKRKAPRSKPEYYERFSRFYYGGRVECMEKGVIEGPVTCVDINSAYPFAMLSPHPIGLSYFYSEGTPSTVRGNMMLTIEAKARGFFPKRAEDGSLSFPNTGEKMEFHVTGWELIEAMKQGATYKGIEFFVFNQCADFSEYVLPFWEKRQEAKRLIETATGTKLLQAKADDLFCKLFLNSLYGKWGSNPTSYENVLLVPPDELALYPIATAKKKGERRLEHAISGQLGNWFLARRDLKDEEMRFYNVACAASITGYVRAMLLNAFPRVDTPLYCDTDSIICKGSGDLPLGFELGAWKNEGTWERAGIAGKKLYVLEGGEKKAKTASKGVKLSPKEIMAIAEGRELYSLPEAPRFSIHAPVTVEAPESVTGTGRKAPRGFIPRKIRRT